MRPHLLTACLAVLLRLASGQLQLQRELHDLRSRQPTVGLSAAYAEPARVLPSVVEVDREARRRQLALRRTAVRPAERETIPAPKPTLQRGEHTDRHVRVSSAAAPRSPPAPPVAPHPSAATGSGQLPRHADQRWGSASPTQLLATARRQLATPSDGSSAAGSAPRQPVLADTAALGVRSESAGGEQPLLELHQPLLELHQPLPELHQPLPELHQPRARLAGSRAAEGRRRQSEVRPDSRPTEAPEPGQTGDARYVQLYSDAWDLESAAPTRAGRRQPPSARPPPHRPTDDSLSALESRLATRNVTLFDAAMHFLLRDDTNLTALFPNASSWNGGDDTNMTRSISVMNALFAALQAGLDGSAVSDDDLSLLQQSSFNPRPVRRTWGRGGAQPHRRAPPVVHRFRPATDQRFLGDRAACGSCEFFMMCWMSGGTVRGGCGGFMFGCCERGQRAGKSFNQPPSPLIDYGPVRNDPDCGLSDTSRTFSRRIVGGNQAGFGTFPWQAYILIGTSRCGGSLINRQHVVTAGHCVARARPGQITITLGDYVLNSNREPLPAYKFRVRAINVHPRFQFTPQADRYDVAVLTLDRQVPYAPHIQPICLPEKGQDFEGFYGWAAGWGALRPGSRVRPKELQVVDVPVINRHMCEEWHRQKGINVIIHKEMMCAGYINGGKDSCQGDSGGPLMIENSGRWYLMGIVSAGYSCAQGKQPGIYHRVSMTSDWISYVAGN